MRTVVTGGAGFIGSTLVDQLVAAGHSVTVIDNFSSGKAENLDQARERAGQRLAVHAIDIRDAQTTATIVEAQPDVVYHLAAQADVRVSVNNPVLDAQINVIGTLHVLEGARRAGARKIVGASSGGTIYGEPLPSALPVDELYPQHPVSPYGVSKKVLCDYMFAYRALHQLDFTALALANVYGPRQDPHGEAGVVAIFAGRLLTGEPCTVFGTGEQTRDYVYVDDVADAFVRAAERGGGLVINIGTGVETSVNALYRSMADAAGVTAEPVRAAARAGELDRSALAITRARTELGWQPGTSLTDGSHAVLDWFRAHRL
ncbi:MAG: NAD-dependent epimerase/dehydratase family protein [Acidimicrobiales bacterium]